MTHCNLILPEIELYNGRTFVDGLIKLQQIIELLRIKSYKVIPRMLVPNYIPLWL